MRAPRNVFSSNMMDRLPLMCDPVCVQVHLYDIFIYPEIQFVIVTPLTSQNVRRTEMSSLWRDYATRLEKQAVG